MLRGPLFAIAVRNNPASSSREGSGVVPVPLAAKQKEQERLQQEVTSIRTVQDS